MNGDELYSEPYQLQAMGDASRFLSIIGSLAAMVKL
jgi:hypothetical protein